MEGQQASLHVRQTVLAGKLVTGMSASEIVSMFNCLEALDGGKTLQMSGVWGLAMFLLIISCYNFF